MKNIFILAFCLFIGNALIAQTNSNYDKRLLSKYSEEQIEELLTEHAQVIAYWEYYLDNAYTIVDIPMEKEIEFEGIIDFKNPATFNILESGAEMHRTTSKFYEIKSDKTKMLVVYSGDMITRKFNQMYHNN